MRNEFKSFEELEEYLADILKESVNFLQEVNYFLNLIGIGVSRKVYGVTVDGKEYAVKVTRFKDNLNEYLFYLNANERLKKKLCPVSYYYSFGKYSMLVMPRVKSINTKDLDSGKYITFKSLFIDIHRDNVGFLDNEMVCIDYSHGLWETLSR